MHDSHHGQPVSQPAVSLEPSTSLFPDGRLSIKRQLLRPQTLLSFALSFLLVGFVFTRLDIPLRQVWANVRGANYGLYLLALLVYYASFYVRALRWKRILHNASSTDPGQAGIPPTPTLFRIVLLSWFVNSVLPARVGDGYRGYLLKRNSGVPFFKAMGTIIVERIVDVGILFTLLVFSMLMAFGHRLPPNLVVLITFGAALAGASVGALVFFRHLGPWIARFLPAKVRPYYDRLQEGVLLGLRGSLSSILLYSVMVWLLDGARFWLVAASLGVKFGVPLVVFIALAASLLSTVPFTPAGLGVVENSVITILLWVMNDVSLSASIALLDRVITYWSLLLIGILLYLFSRYVSRIGL